jgi:uncharacterized membrane protein YhdT
MKNTSLSDRDYSFDEIKVDPRFKICRREMFIALGTWLLYAIISVALGYGLGRGDVANYTYVAGVPLWLFLGSWVSTIVFFVIIVVLVRFVFKDMDISG